MDPLQRALDGIQEKIDRLRREYDLYFAGERRIEPVALRDQIERDILRISRMPGNNTATRFRSRSLGHRFQSLCTQARHRLEARNTRRTGASAAGATGNDVVLDRRALDDGAAADRYIRRLHREVVQACGTAPSFDTLRARVLAETRAKLDEPGVRGVRFRVVRDGETTSIRGAVLRTSQPEAPPFRGADAKTAGNASTEPLPGNRR